MPASFAHTYTRRRRPRRTQLAGRHPGDLVTAVTHRGRGHAKAAVAGIAVAFAAAVILGVGVSVGGLGEIVLTVVFVAFFAVGVATLH